MASNKKSSSAVPSKASSSTSGTPETSDDDYEDRTKVSRIAIKQYLPKQMSPSPDDSPSTPTSVTIERGDSSSTADIPSEVLTDNQDEQQNQQQNVNPTAHKHKLPLGWASSYDPETDEYKFELDHQHANPSSSIIHSGIESAIQTRQGPTTDHTAQTSRRPTLNLFECQYGYHFPSSPTSSMISDLARQVQKASAPQAAAKQAAAKSRLIGYGKTKLAVPTDEEAQLRRLRDTFPTATEPVIEQMIRIYHGKEGLIKAALVSQGYKLSKEYNTQQATAQSPIMLMMSKPASKKLFDKLMGYFPDKDETLIKNLMYKHKEVEHEIISALVESGHRRDKAAVDQYRRTIAGMTEQEAAEATKLDKNGAIMKLRYLKFLYPTCEEIDLFHLLHCNDLNAEKVMEIVEGQGHKQANINEVMQERKSQTQQMRAQQAAHAAKDKPPSAAKDLVEAHKKRVKPSIVATRIENSKSNLKKNFEDYDDGLLLAALEAADYNEDLAIRFLNDMGPIDEESFLHRYELPSTVTTSNLISFPCKAIQKGDTNFMATSSNEFVHIPREVIECQHALALLKVDASTFTGDDFPVKKHTHRQGARPHLRVSSRFNDILGQRALMIKKVKDWKSLRQGSHFEEICMNKDRNKSNALAVGHKKELVRGGNASLNIGHNPELLKRVHPFFT